MTSRSGQARMRRAIGCLYLQMQRVPDVGDRRSTRNVSSGRLVLASDVFLVESRWTNGWTY